MQKRPPESGRPGSTVQPLNTSTIQGIDPAAFVPLPRSFYEPSAAEVAPGLLGQWLVRQTAEGPCGGVIVETEAYVSRDPACHAWAGETPRNRSMFGMPGRAYVYFIYGNHYCVNAVCRPAGQGEAVLIRAIEASFGLEFMRQRREAATDFGLTNGPGKLCQAMSIDRSLDAIDLCDARSALFIARHPFQADFLGMRGPTITTTRIGISKAGELPLRFYLSRSFFVSRRDGSQRRMKKIAS